MLKRFSILLLSLLLVVSLFAGCGSEEPTAGQEPQDDGQKTGGTVRLAMWSSPAGVFNPIYYSDQYDANIIDLVFEGLTKYNEKLEIVPNIAERFEWSDDGKTVTFYLRKDVKFHDGEPLTAEDVYFTFMTICHPDYSGPRTYSVNRLKGYYEYHGKIDEEASTEDNIVYEIEPFTADTVEGIKVIDDYTISFTAVEEYASFLEDLGYGILPAHVFEGVEVKDIPHHEFNTKPIGTGPFKLAEYKKDQYAVLEKFDDYFEGAPKIDKIVYMIRNQETALMELESGELDICDITPQDFDMVSGWDHVDIQETMAMGYQYMAINHRRELFQDQKVRQALAYAINRQGIVDNVLQGHGAVMNAPIPPVSWAYSDDVNAYEYNVEKAKQLLAEAGWTLGSDGILEKNGKKFEVELLYPTGNAVREASAPIIKENLEAVGIKVNLQLMDFPSMREKAINNHDFDLCLIGWGLSFDPDASFAFHSDPAKGSWNYVGYKNERSDELLDAGVATTDMEERKEIYREWCKLVNEDLPYIFLYTQNDILAINNRVKNVKLDVRGITHNIHEWYIDEGK